MQPVKEMCTNTGKDNEAASTETALPRYNGSRDGCIETPHKHDVLCGRGGYVNNHPGNVAFRRVVDANKELYHSCGKDHKTFLVQSIVEAVETQEPPGRFLRKTTNGKWTPIGLEKSLSKTGQALREGASDVRSKLGFPSAVPAEASSSSSAAGYGVVRGNQQGRGGFRHDADIDLVIPKMEVNDKDRSMERIWVKAAHGDPDHRGSEQQAKNPSDSTTGTMKNTSRKRRRLGEPQGSSSGIQPPEPTDNLDSTYFRELTFQQWTDADVGNPDVQLLRSQHDNPSQADDGPPSSQSSNTPSAHEHSSVEIEDDDLSHSGRDRDGMGEDTEDHFFDIEPEPLFIPNRHGQEGQAPVLRRSVVSLDCNDGSERAWRQMLAAAASVESDGEDEF